MLLEFSESHKFLVNNLTGSYISQIQESPEWPQFLQGLKILHLHEVEENG